jgi:uncharacterized protein YndB with AHSA1/START domain
VNDTTAETKSVIVEREIAFPPQKIWRALTQPQLMAGWLMKSDFKPEVDHRFRFTADWGAVDCQVLALDEPRTLSYSWSSYGVETMVEWTLTPTETGTLLRMEQTGFRRDNPQAYGGAKQGWPRFFAILEQTLARLD